MSAAPRVPTRRLFFALWPSESERRALLAASQPALSQLECRAVAPRNLHVTLLFLGQVAVAHTPVLGELAARVAARWHAGTVALRFAQLEHWARPAIVCALERGSGGAAALLSEALRSAAVQAGFAPDLKPFRAHVTVARKVAHAASCQFTPVVWRSTSFVLVESRSVGGASAYSVLESHLLVKAENVHEEP